MTTIEAVYTVGVYGFTEDRFVRALKDAGVDLVVDVRQRRGVRGSTYAFANATRLDSALTASGIAVQPWKDMAPTPALRERQKQADRESNTLKSSRVGLAPAFAAGYTEEVLNAADSDELLQRLNGFGRPALLCVEKSAGACHRSLLARWLAHAADVDVIHLEP